MIFSNMREVTEREVSEFKSFHSCRSALPPSDGKSTNRPRELERMSKNYDARRTVRRRCLSEPMTNLLSPFEGVDRKLRGEKGRGVETEFSTPDSVSRPAGTLPRRNQLLYSSSKHCYANIRITRRRKYRP